MSYRRVVAISELWKGDMMAAVVDDRKVLLVRTDDEILAYEDRCAHLGVALSEGRLEGHVLTCAAHHWQYNVVTGRGINPAHACLTRFATVVSDVDIFVDIDRELSSPQAAPRGPLGSPMQPQDDIAALDGVGPVLEAGETSQALVAAIRKMNANVTIVDRGSYVRVLVPRRCVLARKVVEQSLGKPFRLPGDLELVMPSFKGTLSMTDDEAVWAWRSTP